MTAPVLDRFEPLRNVLTESVAEVKQRERSALTDLLIAHSNRCVIYGAGTLGRKAVGLLREIGAEVLALTDNNAKLWGTEISGTPVLAPADAGQRFGTSAVFFVTIWNDFHWFRDAQAKLTALGCTSISSYAPIFWRFGERFMDLLLLNEPAHRVYQDLDRVLEVEQLWADDESLASYRANILWRAQGDPSHFPFPAPQNTYFPADLFKLNSKEVIVDVGAFDGDTIRSVLSLVGTNLKGLYAIEADAISTRKLSAYLQALPPEIDAKIHTLPYAIGRERCTLHFAMSGAATAATSKDQSAGVEVDCYPLDELFADIPVTFIKMDIEGAEFDALSGGQRIIRRDAPILAICVYHTQNDIWRIPLLMRSMNPQYKFFLRAYDGDGFQSVVYAVPPDRLLSPAERAAAPNPRKPTAAAPPAQL